MKSPLRKFGFGLHKGEARPKRSQQAVSRREELARATQDMEDMRGCYDSLCAAAASTTNTAYEFSESLRELGSCLLEKTALNDDEDSGRVLLMLGKAQFQIQKFIDCYRSHIIKTITNPSVSLLGELQAVEEMKNQCDVKRSTYEHLLASQGVKPRNIRENISPQDLRAALDEYEDEANLFIFRLKSLKQGQSRSLLTQAVRHHAAQMSFFKKGLECLESIEPHVKLITEQQNIDYKFTELEDDDTEDEDSDAYGVNDDEELSSDFEQPQHGTDSVLTTRHSMELDRADHTLAPPLSLDVTQGNQVITQRNSNAIINGPKDVSFSAPILAYPDRMADAVENLRDMKPSTPRKFNTYMLPVPGDAKSATSAGSKKVPGRLSNVNGQTNTLFHSLPLAPKKHPGGYGANRSPERPNLSKSHSILKESNLNNVTGWASIDLEEHKSGWRSFSDNKKVKRQAFSGPLTDNKPWSSKSIPSAGGRTRSVEHPVLISKLFTRIPVPSQRVVSPRLSSSSSPNFISSPKISELHELPRPPGSLAKTNVSSKSSFYTHSAPLASKNQQPSVSEKLSRIPQERSLLPKPPCKVLRSFSIPSSGGERSQSISCLELPVDLGVEALSPPLTPIPFPNSQSAMLSKVSTSKATGDE